MDKLFKLKSWLTIPEAVKYLSMALSEPVLESDVFRLALDGHLKISVNLVNGAQAYLGKYVSTEEIDWTTFSMDLLEKPFTAPSNHEMLIKSKAWESLIKNNLLPLEQFQSNKDYYTQFNNESLRSISGIWDLTLIGSEYLDLKFRYHQEVYLGQAQSEAIIKLIKSKIAPNNPPKAIACLLGCTNSPYIFKFNWTVI
ncbi:hypothetical protein PALB_33910 [Pseudoalteromonas luteoviolacea B = ATCC 29581]|nr:hypothetical protein PALB_33910 [Pseudoalteromonas luteoviolacea B = ATCC 29581]